MTVHRPSHCDLNTILELSTYYCNNVWYECDFEKKILLFEGYKYNYCLKIKYIEKVSMPYPHFSRSYEEVKLLRQNLRSKK